MGLEVCRVDHHGLLFAVFCRQPDHHLREDAFVAPPLPPAVECLVRVIGSRGIPTTQAVAIDEDNPAQYPPVIDPRLTMRLGKEEGQTCDLHVGQQEEIAHVTAPFSKP